jgi:hypothetical protein
MQGLSRSLGVGGTITLCGQKFRANARILRNYAEAEAEVISRRGDPAEMLSSQANKLQEFNTRPFLNKLTEIAKRLSEEKKWGESAKSAVDTLLKIAEKELNQTPYFESLMAMAFDEARRWSGASLPELDTFLRDTWAGQSMRLWFAIREQDDRFYSQEEIAELFSDELESRMNEENAQGRVQDLYAEIEAAITQSEGTDALGNSNGSSSQSSQETEASEKNQSTGTSD